MKFKRSLLVIVLLMDSGHMWISSTSLGFRSPSSPLLSCWGANLTRFHAVTRGDHRNEELGMSNSNHGLHPILTLFDGIRWLLQLHKYIIVQIFMLTFFMCMLPIQYKVGSTICVKT